MASELRVKDAEGDEVYFYNDEPGKLEVDSEAGVIAFTPTTALEFAARLTKWAKTGVLA